MDSEGQANGADASAGDAHWSSAGNHWAHSAGNGGSIADAGDWCRNRLGNGGVGAGEDLGLGEALGGHGGGDTGCVGDGGTGYADSTSDHGSTGSLRKLHFVGIAAAPAHPPKDDADEDEAGRRDGAGPAGSEAMVFAQDEAAEGAAVEASDDSPADDADNYVNHSQDDADCSGADSEEFEDSEDESEVHEHAAHDVERSGGLQGNGPHVADGEVGHDCGVPASSSVAEGDVPEGDVSTVVDSSGDDLVVAGTEGLEDGSEEAADDQESASAPIVVANNGVLNSHHFL